MRNAVDPELGAAEYLKRSLGCWQELQQTFFIPQQQHARYCRYVGARDICNQVQSLEQIFIREGEQRGFAMPFMDSSAQVLYFCRVKVVDRSLRRG